MWDSNGGGECGDRHRGIGLDIRTMLGKTAFRYLIDEIHDHFATSVNEKLCGRPIYEFEKWFDRADIFVHLTESFDQHQQKLLESKTHFMSAACAIFWASVGSSTGVFSSGGGCGQGLP